MKKSVATGPVFTGFMAIALAITLGFLVAISDARHRARSRCARELEQSRAAMDFLEQITGPQAGSLPARLLKAAARVQAIKNAPRAANAAAETDVRHRLLAGIPNGSPLGADKPTITSDFGYRAHPLLKGAIQKHGGIDLRAPAGTPVLITADGVVEYAGQHRKSGLGLLVVIRHQYGFSSGYGHLQKTLVSTGQVVRKGRRIALSGSSGNSTGPHRHYEIRFIGGLLDPKPFLGWSSKNFEAVIQKVPRVNWRAIIKTESSNMIPAKEGFMPGKKEHRRRSKKRTGKTFEVLQRELCNKCRKILETAYKSSP